MSLKDNQIIETAVNVLNIEAKAIEKLCQKIDETFIKACELILNCTGRVIVIGIGKSGHIGRKIAATFASTGTPAHFVHPAEALHGDLGMITKDDVVIAISNSGQTSELLAITPAIKRLGSKLISMTGTPESQLAKFSDTHLHIEIEQEACVLGLAPTTSTTACLAMGDALAVSVLKARGFTPEDFARSHPGGKLGKRLLVKISDLMRSGEGVPKVTENTPLLEAIVEMSKKCLGMTTVVKQDEPETLIGIFTDGDLRRVLDQNIDLKTLTIKDVMTTEFKAIDENILATEAINIMEKHQIFMLPVISGHNKQLVGAFNMHDLLQAGVI